MSQYSRHKALKDNIIILNTVSLTLFNISFDAVCATDLTINLYQL